MQMKQKLSINSAVCLLGTINAKDLAIVHSHFYKQ